MKKNNFNHKMPIAITSMLFCGLVFSFVKTNNPSEVKAVEELSLASEGDAFVLLDKQFAENESFVYTADLHFHNGQAGGLAFGSQENDHYFVINMDRFENHVKLLYFTSNGEGGYRANELRSDWFIGNDKFTDSEKALVNPKVREIENVNLKVILTREEEHAYVEFYVEGIKRFGVDSVIDLNDLIPNLTYQGGYLGMNCFNGSVYLENVEIGKSDYSYFSEPYRNQYHLQPFAKWTNDPNALCYYNGWYHVFYQTHPFGMYWGDMYWGHARSRDLIHFEFLPICLFPDSHTDVLGPGEEVANNGYMWSGCAVTYTRGMSTNIDNLNWFPNGNGNGLLAIYTREGRYQDQYIISSDDEGLTWTKREYSIMHNVYYTVQEFENQRIDWRDPKIVPLEKDGSGKVTRWVMTLSSMDRSVGWFLTSTNLLSWNYAGHFYFPRPECIGIGYLTDKNGVEHAYLTNKSRSYIIGNLSYDSVNNKVVFTDEKGVSLYNYNESTLELKPLDFGPDTYASQSFYINDPASEFNGKDIVLNWFSGDLNASYCTGPGEYAGLRKRWNGGFTIPVEYGIYIDSNDELRISQKPITVDNANLEKTEVVNISNQDINNESDNPLESVHTHIFELEASITTNNNAPITFKVDIGDNEYMDFGWNTTDGYYVDRTNLDDKGINTNVDWHVKYASHILGDSDTKTFYVLSDNGGLEVFCEECSIPFYFVTTDSMFSTGASLDVKDGHINTLKLNEIKSVYRKNIAEGEGVLYVSTDDVTLDTSLCTSKFITCWFTGSSPLVWEELENDGVVEAVSTNQGINLTSLKEGTASYKVSAGEHEQIINVTVYTGSFDSEFTFNKSGIKSGTWVMNENSITGEKTSGNAFLLSNQTGSDFTFNGRFDIVDGVAGALVFRADEDMTSYLVANYDVNEKVVKLWSTHGELARSGVIDAGTTDIVLSIKANEREISIMMNGTSAINYVLGNDEPLFGYFGLNVFSGKATFKSLTLTRENYEYTSRDLAVALGISQTVLAVYNNTNSNTRLEPGFYYQSGDTLYIKEAYFNLLENGTYRFKVVGSISTFYINVEVNMNHTFSVDDMTVESGVNVNVYIGNNVITSLKINGEEVDTSKYSVKDYTLTIQSECFKEGENEVLINDEVAFTVTIENLQDVVVNEKTTTTNTPLIIGISVGSGCLLIGGGVALFFILRHIKRRKAQ